MAENSRVCCFYERATHLPNANEMITLWTRSWRSFGWDTLVLGMAQVRAHPLFAEFNAHAQKFYSRNIGNYDHLCWLRWLAFDQAGGGLMTDYDVINRCLISQDIEPGAPTIHERTRVPCCISADRDGAAAIVTRIMALEPGEKREHFSDMTFFQSSDFPHTETCVEFGHDKWEESKCVHFSRGAVHKWNRENKTGVRREDAVRRFMQI